MRRYAIALALCAALPCAHASDRFTLLQDGSVTSQTWHGDVYGPQNNTYAVQYDAADGDTLFIDSLEYRAWPLPDAYGNAAWYLQAWYMPAGQCNPFGCERTYAWQCPSWAVAGLVVIDCRTLQP